VSGLAGRRRRAHVVPDEGRRGRAGAVCCAAGPGGAPGLSQHNMHRFRAARRAGSASARTRASLLFLRPLPALLIRPRTHPKLGPVHQKTERRRRRDRIRRLHGRRGGAQLQYLRRRPARGGGAWGGEAVLPSPG
jgi:hypothetical protein